MTAPIIQSSRTLGGTLLRCASVAVVIFGLAATLRAQQPADEEGRIRFCAVDLFVDSGSAPLAAYQLEFSATNGSVKIIGIEGGGHPAFAPAPFYDPKALQHERALIAAFSTFKPADLPVGKTRVATVHLQISGPERAGFNLKLQAAADAEGKKVPATASFEQRKTP